MAVKVGIVFIELHMRAAEMLIPAVGRPLHGAFPRPVMSRQVFQGATFRRGILRMGMIVIEARAVRQDQIAFHFVKRERPMGIDLGKLILFLVLLQTGDAEPPRILMRIFAPVVPRRSKLPARWARTNSIDSSTGSTVSRSSLVIPYSVSMPKRCMPDSSTDE